MTKRKAPPIVVMTSVYNHAHFLPECIESVQASTWGDYVQVIVDDASTDDSATVADRYAAQDPRIVVVRLPANRGHGGALNAAIEAVVGDWYLKVDADDWIEPTYLAEIMAAATADAALNVILSPAHVIGAGQDYVFRYPPFDPATMHDQFQIPGPAAFRHALWERVGGFDERLRFAEDWDFWVRAERTGGLRVHQLDTAQWHYRQHDGPRISTVGIAEIRRVKAHLAQHVPASPTLDWRTAPAPDPRMTERTH